MAHLDLQRGTYAAAATLLGSRQSRRIGHNTTLHRYSGPADSAALCVRYHSTDIVTLTADGWLEMSTGGWHTVTTWSRINAILPGPWRVGSDRGTSWLYSRGRRITPYTDGLSIHADTGAVGYGSAVLLTAEDVAAIVAAADAAQTARDAKRAARLLREHPTAGGPRTHSARAWNRRVYGCARCAEEETTERDARRAVLAEEHTAMVAALAASGNPAAEWSAAEYTAAGSHATREEVRTYPPLPGAQYPTWQVDYTAAPTVTIRTRTACPWDCPNR